MNTYDLTISILKCTRCKLRVYRVESFRSEGEEPEVTAANSKNATSLLYELVHELPLVLA